MRMNRDATRGNYSVTLSHGKVMVGNRPVTFGNGKTMLSNRPVTVSKDKTMLSNGRLMLGRQYLRPATAIEQ